MKTHDIVYSAPPPRGAILEKNVFVRMRDGTKLTLDIYKPAGNKGPWPAILAYSPFQKERFFESPKPAFYCQNGYVCVQAAERGSGFNQGQFTFHGSKAAQDGYDIIEWIARQPWCTGKVAMMGASGYGVMQWITAPLNPPHLKALVVLGTTDNYRGLCYPGGVLRKPFVLGLVSGLTMAAIWPGPVSGKEPPVNVIAGIFANTEDGPFWWEHGGGWKNVSKIKAPILNLVQTPNRLHAIYHLRSYADIRSPKKLIITPWTNENYQPWIFETTSFNQQVLRWLDYWLKGIDTGIMDEPEVAVYDNGTGQWRYENEYPVARTRWTKYYVHEKSTGKEPCGLINQTLPAEEEPDLYNNISLNTALTAAYGITGATPASTNQTDVAYVSEPLEDDLCVWGPVSFTLYASTTEKITSDWSFFVKMGEMVPEGVPLNPVTGNPEIKPEANDPWTPREVQIWSWGSLKAKFRLIDEHMSQPGMPWHSFQNPEDIKPNTIYEFQIELQPIFKTFRKGCRIWLKIAGDDALYSTWDSSSRYVETPLSPTNNEISIYHDLKHPSHLLLPVIPYAPEIAPVKPPLSDAVPGAPRFTEQKGRCVMKVRYLVTRFRMQRSQRGRLRHCAAILAAISILAAACTGQSGKRALGRENVVALQNRLEQLEIEAERIGDARAIRRLQRAYGYYVDQGMWNEAADLFAPQGTIEIGLDGVYVGQQRIRQYLLASGGGRTGLRRGQLNEHIILQPVVHVAEDGRTAKARWRALIMTGQLGESAFWGEGTYENEYIKQDRIWRIGKLHWYQTFTVPYAGGWAKNKDSTGGIYVSKHLPPDRPPSERYEVWPGVYTPPFHYKNPVAASSEMTIDADPAIATLARRIRLLQDTDEIENLISTYGYYLDKQQWDLLTDLFAEDSTMEISQRGIYVGKKSVRRAWELFGPQNIERNHLHNHIQMQPVIDVAPDGQRAWVRSRALSQIGAYGGAGIWGDSVYENELVKEKGVWKFKKDHLYTTFFASYDLGWAKGARSTPKASDKIPPDRPPSEIYESFPEIYIPPFHYKNPVTSGTRTAGAGTEAGQIPGELQNAFARVSHKAELLEDERTIENLQMIYGFYIDKQLWKEAADLFASDATLEIGGRGVFVGKARVLEYLTRLSPGGLTRGRLFNHLQLQPIIDVAPDGKTAKARWRFLAESGEYEKSATWGGGSYENEYVNEGGLWKIKTLHAYVRFCTPYADGWGKTALPLSPPEKNLRPDRPPTVSYDPYPSTFVAPPHYKHPVTQK